MRFLLIFLATIFVAFSGIPARAEDTSWSLEALWDWHPGDLIFRNGFDELDEMVRGANGSDWATVGILRSSSGGPRVLYVDRDQGVTEIMLDEFVEDLSADEYVVYRVVSLDSNRAGRQTTQGPLAEFGLLVAYGAAYDDRMILGNEGYYNAELPYIAALSVGTVLASPIPLERMATDDSALRDHLLADWRNHPYCAVAASREECWDAIKGIAIVTPSALTNSDLVKRVLPAE